MKHTHKTMALYALQHNASHLCSTTRLVRFSPSWHEHAWYRVVSLEQHASRGTPRFLSPGCRCMYMCTYMCTCTCTCTYIVYRTCTCTVLPRCYALLAVPPPPLFSGEITVKGYFTSITRPPLRAARADLPYCSSARVRVLQV